MQSAWSQASKRWMWAQLPLMGRWQWRQADRGPMWRFSQSMQVTAFQLAVKASARRPRPQRVARTMWTGRAAIWRY